MSLYIIFLRLENDDKVLNLHTSQYGYTTLYVILTVGYKNDRFKQKCYSIHVKEKGKGVGGSLPWVSYLRLPLLPTPRQNP